MRIVCILSLAVFAFTSYSQNIAAHLFRGGHHTVYVGSGYLEDKHIVSDMQVIPKDSSNREIHVKIEILTDWKLTESLEFDLLLDTVTNAVIETNREKVKAVRYYLKDSDIFIDFEIPSSFTYYNQEKELITIWSSRYALINFPERLKKYRKVLEVYHEK